MASYTATLTEKVKVGSTQIDAGANLTTVSEHFRIGQAQSTRAVLRLAQREKLRIVGGARSTGVFHYMLRQSLKMRERSAIGHGIILSTIVRFSPHVRSATLIRLVEAIEMSARLGLTAHYKRVLSERLRARAVISAGWMRQAIERIGFAPATVDQLIANVRAVEEMVLDSAVNQHLIVHIEHMETLSLDDALHVQALYKNAAIEVVTFGLKLHQPNGASTTWVINTRSGAVTEYTDYAYRSFTRLPNGIYLGAGEDGNLYELEGDQDGTMPIVADVVGGMLDMGGSHFTQLKAVYLGVRASGKFYLKLTTDNDVTRTYEVRTIPNRTARIDIGKGMRSKYVQWELISTGQDFDVQSVEFVPLVAKRRI